MNFTESALLVNTELVFGNGTSEIQFTTRFEAQASISFGTTVSVAQLVTELQGPVISRQ
jgi:hypothetical protein